MPNSLKSKLSKLRYKGKITEDEYNELLKKLIGHDHELYVRACAVGYELGYKDGINDGIQAME